MRRTRETVDLSSMNGAIHLPYTDATTGVLSKAATRMRPLLVIGLMIPLEVTERRSIVTPEDSTEPTRASWAGLKTSSMSNTWSSVSETDVEPLAMCS